MAKSITIYSYYRIITTLKIHTFEKAFNDMRNCSYQVENSIWVVRTHHIVHARFLHLTVYVTLNISQKNKKIINKYQTLVNTFAFCSGMS